MGLRSLASSFIPLVFFVTQVIGVGSKASAQLNSMQQGLIKASENCDRELASILINRGANPNFHLAGNSQGRQPITTAIEEFNNTFNSFDKEQERQQCLNFINYLLENQADPNLLFAPIENTSVPYEFVNVAPSPLFEAIEVAFLNRSGSTGSYTQVVETLLNNGANPNLRSLHKYNYLPVNSTPLMLLMKESVVNYDRHRQIWDIMLPISDVNLQNNDGETALMLLIEHSPHDNEVKVKRLLEAGARTDIKNARGLTALDIAISKGKTDIVKLLIE